MTQPFLPPPPKQRMSEGLKALLGCCALGIIFCIFMAILAMTGSLDEVADTTTTVTYGPYEEAPGTITSLQFAEADREAAKILVAGAMCEEFREWCETIPDSFEEDLTVSCGLLIFVDPTNTKSDEDLGNGVANAMSGRVSLGEVTMEYATNIVAMSAAVDQVRDELCN